MNLENPDFNNSAETEENQRKRPGGELAIKPVEIEGVFYDPYDPPKLFEGPGGKKDYVGGKEITKDEAYSMMFWNKERAEGLRGAMEDNINNYLKAGFISIFVDAEKSEGGFELKQESKEKLSAYRVLAEKLGYIIGPYKYNEKSGNVQAKISKKGEATFN